MSTWKNFLKKPFNQLLRHLGYQLVKYSSSGKAYNHFENHLKTLFERLEINCVLDIGAHVGTYRNFLRKNIEYSGLIVSFEPIKKHIDILRQGSEKDDNWEIEAYALGSEEAQMTINVMKTSDFSSFLAPDTSNTDHIIIGENPTQYQLSSHNIVDYQEVCDVKRFDNAMEDLQSRVCIENIFVKIDTQGYDLEVIKGAQRTLEEKILALQFEASCLGIYKGMPNYLNVLHELSEKGFDITFFNPIAKDNLFRIVEFDCILINRFLTKH